MIIQAKAPLRVSFAGGGTDVPPFPQDEGGCVLSATINAFAYGMLETRDDGLIVIESEDYGIGTSIQSSDGIEYNGTLDLAKAAINVCVREWGLVDPFPGCKITLRCDVKPGTGLGSSSAMAVMLVGLLRGLSCWATPYREKRGAHHTARLAHQIERKELGMPGGMQDQYAAAYGGLNLMHFGNTVSVDPVKEWFGHSVINELEGSLLLCDTGQTRHSGDVIEDQTRRYYEADQEALQGLRALKVLVGEMSEAVRRGELKHFGELLDRAWHEKKRMSDKITNQTIDAMYVHAIEAGALGGKINGAGGGGYLLLYCQPSKIDHVIEEMSSFGPVNRVQLTMEGLQSWEVRSE